MLHHIAQLDDSDEPEQQLRILPPMKLRCALQKTVSVPRHRRAQRRE